MAARGGRRAVLSAGTPRRGRRKWRRRPGGGPGAPGPGPWGPRALRAVFAVPHAGRPHRHRRGPGPAAGHGRIYLDTGQQPLRLGRRAGPRARHPGSARLRGTGPHGGPGRASPYLPGRRRPGPVCGRKLTLCARPAARGSAHRAARVRRCLPRLHGGPASRNERSRISGARWSGTFADSSERKRTGQAKQETSRYGELCLLYPTVAADLVCPTISKLWVRRRY